MRIGELAKRLGVATSKLRFLEAHGLIRPARRLASGYRDYDDSAVETLQIILQAQSFGFTLEEISRSFVETRQHGLRCDYIIKLLNGKLQELDRHIEQTRALRARLVCAVDEFEGAPRSQPAAERVGQATHLVCRRRDWSPPWAARAHVEQMRRRGRAYSRNLLSARGDQLQAQRHHGELKSREILAARAGPCRSAARDTLGLASVINRVQELCAPPYRRSPRMTHDNQLVLERNLGSPDKDDRRKGSRMMKPHLTVRLFFVAAGAGKAKHQPLSGFCP